MNSWYGHWNIEVVSSNPNCDIVCIQRRRTVKQTRFVLQMIVYNTNSESLSLQP